MGFLSDRLFPCLKTAVAAAGGVALSPIIAEALRMGDELHSRNLAASVLFLRELAPFVFAQKQSRGSGSGGAVGEGALAPLDDGAISHVWRWLSAESNYFFLRIAMAASRAAVEAGHGVPGSAVVTGLCFNCKEVSLRVSGGDWVSQPHNQSLGAGLKLFDGYTEADASWMGGESCTNEMVGWGAMAQSGAFSLQKYSQASPAEMMSTNQELCQVCRACAHFARAACQNSVHQLSCAVVSVCHDNGLFVAWCRSQCRRATSTCFQLLAFAAARSACMLERHWSWVFSRSSTVVYRTRQGAWLVPAQLLCPGHFCRKQLTRWSWPANK
jgi:hypothetical protein